jgi:Fe-S cluster assembly iron-binding protein IscA
MFHHGVLFLLYLTTVSPKPVKHLSLAAQVLLYVVLAAMPGCQSRTESHSEDTIAYDSVEALADSLPQGTGDAIDFVDCPRGAPERIVKASVEPQPTFELDKRKNIASEVLQFQNGDRLVVKNGGCEYFVVTFRFETNRFKADTTDMVYWLDKSAVLVAEISEAIDAPLDFNDGVAMIKRMNGPEVKYLPGQEIVYSDGEIRQFATLDRVEQLDPSRYAVEVTFSLGPI